MKQFFGRKHELEQLSLLTKKKTSSLVTITGRRRIGKSRLVQEFIQQNSQYQHFEISGLAPVDGVGPKAQKVEFARGLNRRFKGTISPHDDWSDLFSNLAEQTSEGKWIILMDEISWMGTRDSQFLSKLKNAWDLLFKRNEHLILILCGSVSSWIERNLINQTGFVGRISLKLRLGELSVSESLGFWGDAQWSRYDILKVLSVTGGVPRYLEEVLPHLTADENITRLCFLPEGILFFEFDQIFNDLFSTKGAEYKKIVSYLVDKTDTFVNICKALKLSSNGITSKRFDDLVSAGFLTRDYSWNLNNFKNSKINRFRISDNYLRFYLKYILPAKNSIVTGRFVSKPVVTLPGYNIIMGFAFENLILKNRSFIWESLNLAPGQIVQDGPYIQTFTKKHEGCQIDYLIQIRQGPLYVCEIKFHNKHIGLAIKKELKNKISKLIIPRHCSIIPVIIHIGGVTEQVKYDDYFAHIIDTSQLFTP